MALFSVTIPDAQATRVVAALCAAGGFQGADVTPENARAFIVAYVKQTVQNVELAAFRAAQDAMTGPGPIDIT